MLKASGLKVLCVAHGFQAVSGGKDKTSTLKIMSIAIDTNCA